MTGVLHFKRKNVTFDPIGNPPGKAGLAAQVGPAQSRTMGAGLCMFDGCSIEWTVIYDEMLVVLEGKLRLVLRDRTIEAGPGDVIWLPENTWMKYEGEKAVCCYAVYPVDWQTTRQPKT